MNHSFSEDPTDYLKYILNEDIYIVQETNNQYDAKTITPLTPPQSDSQSRVSIPQKTYKVGIVAGSETEINNNKEFISKMLQAIGIQWNEAFSITSKIESLSNFESFLIFGSNNQNLVSYSSPISLNQSLKQGIQKFIFTYSLSELENNKEKKMALWKAMQETYLKK